MMLPFIPPIANGGANVAAAAADYLAIVRATGPLELFHMTEGGGAVLAAVIDPMNWVVV